MHKQSLVTLEDFRSAVEEEVEFVGVKPFSHNIIMILLQGISQKFGKDEANNAIEDFGLEKYGWSKA